MSKEKKPLVSHLEALIVIVAMLGGFGLLILSYVSSVWQFAYLGLILIGACSIHLTTLKKKEKVDG